MVTLRESVSQLARILRKSFVVELWADGRATCTEVSTAPPETTSLLSWRGTISDRFSALTELLSRTGVASWPDVVGEGRAELDLWLRDEAGAGVRRVLRVAFDDDQPRVTDEAARLGAFELVALVDEIVEAIRSGAARRAAVSAEQAFPSADDRRARRRSLRFTETHDWDGSTPYNKLIDARVSEDGRVEAREVDTSNGGYRVSRRRSVELEQGARVELFARLSALDWSAVRRSAGGGSLDTMYTQRVEYFDGAKVIAFEYVWTRERGLGVSDGGHPPNAVERTLLDLAAALTLR